MRVLFMLRPQSAESAAIAEINAPSRPTISAEKSRAAAIQYPTPSAAFTSVFSIRLYAVRSIRREDASAPGFCSSLMSRSWTGGRRRLPLGSVAR